MSSYLKKNKYSDIYYKLQKKIMISIIVQFMIIEKSSMKQPSPYMIDINI